MGIKYLKSWQKKGKTQYTSDPIHRGSQLNFTHVEIPSKKAIMYKIKVLTDKCAQEEMFFSAYSYVNNPPNYAQSSVLTKRVCMHACPAGRGRAAHIARSHIHPHHNASHPRQVLTIRGKKDPPCAPTPAPTHAPTGAPTKMPTEAPTQQPTASPTPAPTRAPTKSPTCAPAFRSCPSGQAVTSTMICSVVSYCTATDGTCPEGSTYPPGGNLVVNGGFEANTGSTDDWTAISPITPGGIETSPVWQGDYSLEQGQTRYG